MSNHQLFSYSYSGVRLDGSGTEQQSGGQSRHERTFEQKSLYTNYNMQVRWDGMGCVEGMRGGGRRRKEGREGVGL